MGPSSGRRRLHAVLFGIRELFLRKWERKPFLKYTKSSSFTHIFIWVTKLDSISLTKTKNWSGRTEVTETSGRLHPLWPQNKWLHTPRTADYRHTRQDRWIQTELAFTLDKECHKTESLWNHTATDSKEREKLEDQRSVGASSCNCGDGTGQRVRSLMFMMIMYLW